MLYHPLQADYPSRFALCKPYQTFAAFRYHQKLDVTSGNQSHQSDPRVLNRRTLERDHRRLAEVLLPGMTVLDVGCGTGAITAGIARAVGPEGQAVGIDRDAALLAIARQEFQAVGNLRFENGDALSLPFENGFDVVTASRALQWISRPDLAIRQMRRA